VSPLTKLFVVLLVLVSIVLTAGVVTFVNKVEPLQKTIVTLKSDVANAKQLLEQKNAEYAASVSALDKAQSDAASEAGSLRTAALTLRSTIEERDKAVAGLETKVAVLTSTTQQQAVAVEASEKGRAELNNQILALRKDADERLRQVADYSTRVNKLVADLEQTERQRRNLAEQLTAATVKTDKQAKLLLDMGVTTAQLEKSDAGLRAGAPAINGVVRSRRNIAGKEYATISIGSQDQVAKGMEFNILDANTGAFLGKLKVEVVDQNEAVGEIMAEPQNLAQVKPGNVVKTQI